MEPFIFLDVVKALYQNQSVTNTSSHTPRQTFQEWVGTQLLNSLLFQLRFEKKALRHRMRCMQRESQSRSKCVAGQSQHDEGCNSRALSLLKICGCMHNEGMQFTSLSYHSLNVGAITSPFNCPDSMRSNETGYAYDDTPTHRPLRIKLRATFHIVSNTLLVHPMCCPHRHRAIDHAWTVYEAGHRLRLTAPVQLLLHLRLLAPLPHAFCHRIPSTSLT